MSDFYKDMRFPKLEKGKILTLDEEGKLIASDSEITDIAKNSELIEIEERVTNLETSMGDAQSRLEAINGEIV